MLSGHKPCDPCDLWDGASVQLTGLSFVFTDRRPRHTDLMGSDFIKGY